MFDVDKHIWQLVHDTDRKLTHKDIILSVFTWFAGLDEDVRVRVLHQDGKGVSAQVEHGDDQGPTRRTGQKKGRSSKSSQRPQQRA